jgi:hypothetical protein
MLPTELIGEEILDEFDLTGPQAASSYIPPSAKLAEEERFRRAQANSAPYSAPSTPKPAMQFSKVSSTLSIFSRSRSQPGTPRAGATVTASAGDAINKEDSFTATEKIPDLKIFDDCEGTDASTLHVTLTSETTTTLSPDVLLVAPVPQSDSRIAPALLLSNDRGHTTPISNISNPNGSPFRNTSPVPLAEVILQTQNRRRAQAQQQQQTSATGTVLSFPGGTGGGAAGGGAGGADGAGLGGLPQPQRQVVLPKGRFKSSPLVTLSDEKANDKDKEMEMNEAMEKILHLDHDLEKLKEGL